MDTGGAIDLIYNIFVTGTGYSFITHKTIVFSIGGIIIVIVLSFGIYATILNLKIIKKLKKVCDINNISPHILEAEFNSLAIKLHRGIGLQITK